MKFPAPVSVPRDPCNPSPCGANAQCRDGICSCLSEYTGDPFTGCRPECVLNTDCPQAFACMRNKCRDPCPGTCSQNAVCNVYNHIPMCSCPAGTSGNAFFSCSTIRGINRKNSKVIMKLNCYPSHMNILKILLNRTYCGGPL